MKRKRYEWRVICISATFGRITKSMPNKKAAYSEQADMDKWGGGIGIPSDVVEIQRREVGPWERVEKFPRTYRSKGGSKG